jgi:hypothetical protein
MEYAVSSYFAWYQSSTGEADPRVDETEYRGFRPGGAEG